MSSETAPKRGEEGGDEVKSARLLRPGLHTRYNGQNRGSRWREPELIPQIWPQLELQAETRLHERGVASNRRSAHCGEYVPGGLYTPPVKSWKSVTLEVAGLTARRQAPRVGLVTGTKS